MTVEEVRKVEGESVTLHSGVQKYFRIILTFGLNKIAQCWGNTSVTPPPCEITDKRFRDRLKTDSQTGSFTIINITNEDAGLYKLQIFNNSRMLSSKDFNVTVSGE